MGEPGEGEVQRITEVNDETASYGGGDMGTEVYGLNSSENVGGKWGTFGSEYVFSFFFFFFFFFFGFWGSLVITYKF